MTEEIKRVYELGYIISPSTSENEIEKEVDTLKSAISTVGSTVVAEGAPEFIDLAYTMEKNIASKKMKYDQGYFGWIKFEGAPANVEALKKSLDSNLALVRYILIKTTIENNIVFKKPKVEAKRFLANDEDLSVSEDDLSDEVVDLHDEHENLPELGDVQSEASEEESL
jgi:ribosomal protein S6